MKNKFIQKYVAVNAFVKMDSKNAIGDVCHHLLFIKSLKGLKQADSILLILAGSILAGPLISLITDFYFILPYRFIPFVIFTAIGIGIIFSKKKTNLE